MDLIGSIFSAIASTAFDVVPIAAFLIFFHGVVLGRRFVNIWRIIVGLGCVVAGLGLFLLGLERALFPLGRFVAEQLTAIGSGANADALLPWYSYYWVLIFAFAIGFSSAIAEPALLAVTLKAGEVSGGAIHVWGLRVVVALGVGFGVALGCFRILTGTPLQWYIAAAYAVVLIQTAFAPRLLVPLAYDSGGVTTSTVTVPLVTALGLGLAANVPGRSVLLDGFGMIALTCLFPIMTVLAYAQITALLDARREARERARNRDRQSPTED